MPLRVGDQVPHFSVRTDGGETLSYATLWQSQNLVLLALPPGAQLPPDIGDPRELETPDTRLVVTRDAIPGLDPPAVLVADKWGEVVHLTAGSVDSLPDRRDLAEWIDHVRQRCPECEGEAH